MSLTNALFGVIGYLTGSITIFLIFFRNINKLSMITSKHDIRIQNNADDINDIKHDDFADLKAECKQAVELHNSTLGVISKIVDQNNLLIQKQIARAES